MKVRKRSRTKKSLVELSTRVSRSATPPLGLRYALMVAAIAVPLFAIYFYPYARTGAMAAGIHSYLSLYAKMVGAAISLFEPRVAVLGDTIAGQNFSIQIVKTCDAIEVNILLVAALAALPISLGRRLAAVLASVVLLVLVNVMRICVLYWLGVHAPTWFHRAHQTLAPLCMVVCGTVIFLIAISQIAPRFSQDEVGRRVRS
ncbi:MAG: archaeosortase/exosortase family protein [Polyangia bacterium]|jgi:exosortase/archaeosortase family protein